MSDKKFVDFLKGLDWQTVINVCHSLEDLNDSQFRFLKGRFIEILVENSSKGILQFVGEKHKDFDCAKFKCSVELKSEVSNNLYKKSGLRSSFRVRFNNSHGTNKTLLDPNFVADYVIIVKKDGVVLVDKNTVLSNVVHQGDGFDLVLKPENVTELSGRIQIDKKYEINVRSKIDNLLRESITNLNKFITE